MKKKLLMLMAITAVCLTACKKDDTAPEIQQYIATQNILPIAASANSNTAVTSFITGTFRIKLAADSINTDDILIAFNANSKPTFVVNEDAPYMQGFGQVSLSSLSSDNVALAINELPLPTLSLGIRLQVSGKTDGAYNLSMASVKALPPIFKIWLKDNYLKDSVDFKSHPSYAFNILNADTTTYGSHRFRLVVRQDKTLGVSLLNFTAAKASSGILVSWKTTHEFNYTTFIVERSANNSNVYYDLCTDASFGTGTYSFLDSTPVAGTNRYRLKLVDLNGSVSYSDLVPVGY